MEKYRKKNVGATKMNAKYILTFLIILIIGTVGTAQENYKYGGIALSANDPPPGTTINEKLSSYYGTPIATGDNKVYWHIGGYGWFNQTEMLKLPSVSLMYDISPYDCESYGCGSSSDSQSIIAAPVSGIVIVGFIGISVMLWRKHAPN